MPVPSVSHLSMRASVFSVIPDIYHLFFLVLRFFYAEVMIKDFLRADIPPLLRMSVPSHGHCLHLLET